jgi:hypothetical protein
VKIRIKLTRAQKDIVDAQARRAGLLRTGSARGKYRKEARLKVLEAMIEMGLDALKKEQDKQADPADVYGPDQPAF